MSRNLCKTRCDACCGVVLKMEENRRATVADVGAYVSFVGMLVANAECSECGAKYLAWVDVRGSEHHRLYFSHYAFEEPDLDSFDDLSYRSTFYDEPGEADLPVWYPWRCFAKAMAEALVGVCKAMVASEEWWAWLSNVESEA